MHLSCGRQKTTTTTTTTTTTLPIASPRFLSRKMNHLSERIIPHLEGRVEIHHFVVPIHRNPTLLCQETSFTWRPGAGRYSKYFAHSGSHDTRWQRDSFSKEIYSWPSPRPGLFRFRYDGIDSGTTESIPVLQDRFLYYGIDSGTTESILVLQSRFRHDGLDSCITESIPVLQARILYYGVDSGITESIPVLQDRFLYYGINSNTTKPILVRRSRFRYYGVDSGLTEAIPVLLNRFL